MHIIMIDDSEKEDFQQMVRKKGLDPNDFELVEKEDPPVGGEIYAITGKVIVKRKSNGFEKSYNWSTWLMESFNDLSSGLFD